MEKGSKIIRSVALYRVLAMLIVLVYHLVGIPSWALKIPHVFTNQLGKPILPENSLNLVSLRIGNYLHTNFGAFAVMMFFIASGYLVSKMMDRYNRREFLVNRAISSFPTLWVCLITIAIFVERQGITFTFADYLASGFPFLPLPFGQFMSDVLWTLRIEMKFYILTALFYRRRKQMVFYGYMLMLLLALFYHEFRTAWVLEQLQDLLFMGFAFLGVVIEAVYRKQEYKGLIVFFTLLNLLMFRIRQFASLDEGLTYSNCATQIIPLVLFLLLLKLEERQPYVYEVIPHFVYSIGKIVYPFYLTHVPCGLTIMYQLSLAGWENPYAICLCGVAVSFAVAGLVYLVVTKPSGMLMKRGVAAMRERRRSEDV